jgi:CubicO group peptidase (beta-lactamase class C family)
MKVKMNRLRIFEKSLVMLLLWLFVFSGGLLTAADPVPTAELDRYIARYEQVMNIPAGAIEVLHQGETVYTRTWGTDGSADARFYIGSISKPITALAVMQLVEQDQVDLDASVSQYIPEFTVSEAITVRHLLQHVSGMTEFDFMTSLPPMATPAELVEAMNGMTPSHAPGEVFAYFNPNYSLLGYLVERVSGESYADYMENRIFVPLAMNRSSARGLVDVPGHLTIFGFSWEREEPFLLYDLPAGYMTASAADLTRFLEAIRTRDPALGVSAENIEAMLAPGELVPYGMGWMTGTYAQRPAIHHGGSLPGYVSDALILPEDELSIAVLVNKNHMLSAVFLYPDLVEGIVSILTGQPATDRLTLHWIYRLFGVLFILSVLSNIGKILKLYVWPGRLPSWRRSLAIWLNLLIPVAVVFIVPVVSRTVLQRGFTWELGILLVPDFLPWLLIGLGFQFLEGIGHAIAQGRGIDRRS